MKQVCGDKELRKRLREEFPGFELEMLSVEVAELFNVSSESAKIRIKQLGFDFEHSPVNQKTIFTIGYPSSVFSL